MFDEIIHGAEESVTDGGVWFGAGGAAAGTAIAIQQVAQPAVVINLRTDGRKIIDTAYKQYCHSRIP